MTRRKPVSHLRGADSFRRKPGRKAPRSVTLIVCEGETEQVYLEAARIKYALTTAEIILAENTIGPAPISVVRCAESKFAEPGGYDTIFCVFDRDGHESFDRARERINTLAKRKNQPLPIQEAISIPCFEYWVLLHHVRTDAPFHCCADAIDQVRNYMPGYEKADAAVVRQLMARVDDALANAKWVEGRAKDNDYNPYTSVHQVLAHFEQVANPESNV
jgi:hypothetical protein